MKTLNTLFLLLMGLASVAQRSSYHQEIDDDGKRLTIRIDRQANGKTYYYSNTYDVRGMSEADKDALVSRVLAAEKAEGGKAYTAAAPLESPAAAPQPPVAVVVASTEPVAPFKKTIEEDTVAHRIKVIYEYMRNGEEHSFEITIDKEGRTEKEIQKRIEEAEESIGFTPKSS
ncbi:hypothetical protein [Salmonirosea aquatica]|uniref:Uncharacterized protein n=1 Tax=Salmonirosea aquatica TaxID=2654236 RepID=A0A7C9F4A2_9BACT|nr:hypothetical protein [Cytophagaceae bacterium SJW1-29]